MERDVEAMALACEQSEPMDLAGLAGSFLLFRCFIAGAIRFGLRPVRAVGWWRRAWQAVGGDVFLPPFLPDTAWNGLAEESSRIALVATPRNEPEDAAALVAKLTTSDFMALQPALTVIQLNSEFLDAWKKWIPVTPLTFARTLMRGMPAARSELDLYPEGGGNVDLRDFDHDFLRGQLQLRFSIPDKVMHIDEIRLREPATGTGLFQRMIFNTEELAAILGLERVEVLATDIGRYALARVGVYPHDPELWKTIKKSD
jgi:hypothetical protein